MGRRMARVAGGDGVQIGMAVPEHLACFTEYTTPIAKPSSFASGGSYETEPEIGNNSIAV